MPEKVEYILVTAKATIPPAGPGTEEVRMVKGDTVETEMKLDEMFPGKFERLDRTPTVTGKKFKSKPPAKPAAVEEDSSAAVKEVDSKPEESHEEGEDVTTNYPLAVENDLKVRYVTKVGFTIYDGSSAVNETPLRSNKDVASKLKEYVGVKK